MGGALAHPPLFGSNLAMRRDVWERVAGSVHRTRQDLHDDVDLSYHVGDVGTIRHDPSLVVGISARPLRSWSGLGVRVRRIVSISEGGGFRPPVPMPMMAMARGKAEAYDTAVSPGETALSANLDVVFELGN